MFSHVLRLCLTLSLLARVAQCAVAPQTEGQPWPMPQSYLPGKNVQSLNSDSFRFNVVGKDCDSGATFCRMRSFATSRLYFERLRVATLRRCTGMGCCGSTLGVGPRSGGGNKMMERLPRARLVVEHFEASIWKWDSIVPICTLRSIWMSRVCRRIRKLWNVEILPAVVTPSFRNNTTREARLSP